MAKKENGYVAEQRKRHKAGIDMPCEKLPPYCAEYADSMLDVKQPRTILAYLQDLDVFLDFLRQSKPELAGVPLKEIPVSTFDGLTKKDVHDFSKWLGDYDKRNRHTGAEEHHHNESIGKRRKLASLRTFYDYLVNDAELIANNPVIMTKLPRADKKDIRIVETDELPRILDVLQAELDRTRDNYEEKKGERRKREQGLQGIRRRPKGRRRNLSLPRLRAPHIGARRDRPRGLQEGFRTHKHHTEGRQGGPCVHRRGRRGEGR